MERYTHEIDQVHVRRLLGTAIRSRSAREEPLDLRVMVGPVGLPALLTGRDRVRIDAQGSALMHGALTEALRYRTTDLR